MTIVQKLKDERVKIIDTLKRLADLGQLDDLLKLSKTLLYENPDDPVALFYTANALNGQNHTELAYLIMRRAISLRSDRAEMWQQMGHLADKMWRFDEALYCYEKALEINPDDDESLASITSAYVGLGKPEIAKEYALKALELNPSSDMARVNLGFSQMKLGEWSEAWDNYDKLLGHKSGSRKATAYTNPPKMWDGETFENVVVYGEQGVGDEIMFASVIPDAVNEAKHIVIDCHYKLAGLFKRSFPDCSVYGTRLDNAPAWMAAEDIDSSCAIATLPKFYRRSAEAFPGTPYLIADPERKRMYRALLDGLGEGLKVGISWTGGNAKGGLRRLELDKLQELVEAFPQVQWVSLQYLDTPMMGLPIHEFKYATQTDDYDDTAALVDELDLVITVPQSVAHLAGALGKECWILAPDIARWIYGMDGEAHTWYGSARIFRGWDTMLEQVMTALDKKLNTKLEKKSA